MNNLIYLRNIYQIGDFHIQESEEENYRVKEALDYFIDYIKNDNINKENKCVMILGDIIDKKTINHSRYCIKYIKSLLDELTSICKVFIILGNHDYIRSEIDNNITNIFDFLKDLTNINNLTILEKKKINNNNFFIKSIPHYYNLSDVNLKLDNTYKDKINICLYHGDFNNKLYNVDFTRELFKNYDIVMLGHYHEYFKISDNIIYSGSLIQNNFSESNNHGFIKWTIKDKNNIKNEFINIPSNYNYLIIIDNNIEIQKLKLSDKCEKIFFKDLNNYKTDKKLYLKVYSNKSSKDIYNLIYNYLNKDNIIDIKIVNFDNNNITNDIKNNLQQINNINDKQYLINIYKNLLYDKNDDEEINNDRLKIITDIINETKFNDNNIKTKFIKLKHIKFNNILTYGDNNEIHFDKFNNAIIGINGDNGVGKSSLINIIIYSIYGLIIKNKTDYINCNINQEIINNRREGYTEIEFYVNDNLYKIITNIYFYPQRIIDKRSIYIYNKQFNNFELLTNFNENKTKCFNDFINIFGTVEDFTSSFVIKQKELGICEMNDNQRYNLFCDKLNFNSIKSINSKIINDRKTLITIINKYIDKLNITDIKKSSSIFDKLNYFQSIYNNNIDLIDNNNLQLQSLQSQLSIRIK